MEPAVLNAFQRWLDRRDCYVFTINGFPFGPFHGTSVKEQVYVPDWTMPERVAYTNRLFDLLARFVPSGMEGSVSTVPGSFKEFIQTPDQEAAMRRHLWQCVEHIATVSERSGRDLHLGLEPEPLCYLETTPEAVRFFERCGRTGRGTRAWAGTSGSITTRAIWRSSSKIPRWGSISSPKRAFA